MCSPSARELAAADLLITGEGRFNRSSLLGKAVGEALERAHRARTTAAFVAGQIAAGGDGAGMLVSLTTLAGDDASARARPLYWIRNAGAALATDASEGDEVVS
ncbi:glycerate kinase [Streptomyces sp. NBC_00401]|uniref:glycerate kinase n=1 Tax=unclassified Streptomyces TaxID=2593676 RepID=UPI0022587975|nr:glycerate kinase [Streptomyces sp. NBC_00401]MCX5085424.1 glycerate kinase [Streptomyces sp. NBC_00401]